MNAPMPPAGATLQASLPISAIVASLTNPRKRFPEEYIKQLASSIKAKGLLQPITVRPLPATRRKLLKADVQYELVMGECRFRACVEAGLTDIPAFWRELDDEDVLEMQIVENLQRQDVHPMEEAEGLYRLQHELKYSLEKIQEKIGLGRTSVTNKLKLMDLCPALREKFLDGKMPSASHAMIIARVPDEKLQLQAFKEIIEGRHWSGVPLSYKDALEHLQRNFMLKLAEAPFPRAEDNLIPGVGRCHECPKRTGNAPDLFSDVKSADVCTDPGCYKAKSEAQAKRQAAEAKQTGRTVIDGEDARKIMPYASRENDLGGGMVSLDKKVNVDGKQVPVRKLLDDADIDKAAILIVPDKAGKTVDVISTASIKAKLEAKGVDLTTLSSRLKNQDTKDAEKKERQRVKDETEFRQRLHSRIRSEATLRMVGGMVLGIDDLVLVTARMYEELGYVLQREIADLWLGQQNNASVIAEFKKSLATRPAHELYRLQLDMAIIHERSFDPHNQPAGMLALAKRLDIDTAALKREIIAENRVTTPVKAKAAAAKPKKPATSTADKSAQTPSLAAQAKDKKGQKQNPEAAPAPANKQPARPKAKTNPAPAKPAKEEKKTNPEQASPAEEKKTESTATAPGIKSELSLQAWPFPTGVRK